MSSPIRVTLVGMCKVDKGFVKARPQDVASVLYFTGDSVTTKDYFHLQMIGGRYVLTTRVVSTTSFITLPITIGLRRQTV